MIFLYSSTSVVIMLNIAPKHCYLVYNFLS